MEIDQLLAKEKEFITYLAQRGGMDGTVQDVTTLFAEVRRLRKIEDIARAVNNCICEFGDDAPGACGEKIQWLDDVLEANPRPEAKS